MVMSRKRVRITDLDDLWVGWSLKSLELECGLEVLGFWKLLYGLAGHPGHGVGFAISLASA